MNQIVNCINCSRCCYDGVYLNEKEISKLTKFVNTHPEYFTHLPEQFIVEGKWGNEISGSKTATKPHRWGQQIPKHFNQTICVFSVNGKCSIQLADIALGYHPWEHKPISCWLFPMRLVDGKLVPPPETKKDDPHYMGIDYPGYVTCLPCYKENIIWEEICQEEIYFFNRNKNVL